GERAAGLQDALLHGGVAAPGLVRHAGPVAPLDAVQPLSGGTLHPQGHGGNADAEPGGDAAQRLPLADGGYHGATALRLTLCWLIELLPKGSVLGRLWPSAVRDVLALNCSGRIGPCPVMAFRPRCARWSCPCRRPIVRLRPHGRGACCCGFLADS